MGALARYRLKPFARSAGNQNRHRNCQGQHPRQIEGEKLEHSCDPDPLGQDEVDHLEQQVHRQHEDDDRKAEPEWTNVLQQYIPSEYGHRPNPESKAPEVSFLNIR